MLKLANVVKEYETFEGRVCAVDHVSFTLKKGTRIGILGKNGSGKSTLIRLIGGVETPTSGRITRNMSVSWPLAFRGGFRPSMSAESNIRFLSRIYGRDFDEMRSFVEEFTELGVRLRDPVATFSSGMRAKLSFGVSLAIEFDCYLIDEIFAVGDQRFRKKCREELFEKRKDRSLIMVSHQMGVIEQSCHAAILIENGRCNDVFDVTTGKEWRRHVP